IGRFLVDRRYNKEHPTPTHEGSHGPDTDVFAAVRDDEKTRETRSPEARTQEAKTQELRTR
ncbi:MAG: hypothetical protein JO191_03265, partial [Mycobacteriaceae bacterium]|nr:hypothetical protein [Mycobacteriaceae bacterium]